MKRIYHFPILLLGLCLCVGCAAADGAKDGAKTTYLYKGFDTNGNQVVEGVLNLSINATNRVDGDWKLQETKNHPLKRLGPQTGSGKLTGHISDKEIRLNLNPGWSDNNVMLDGRMTATNISGTWGFYGFAGEMSRGKFEAVKK